jgi:hypothetical protein
MHATSSGVAALFTPIVTCPRTFSNSTTRAAKHVVSIFLFFWEIRHRRKICAFVAPFLDAEIPRCPQKFYFWNRARGAHFLVRFSISHQRKGHLFQMEPESSKTIILEEEEEEEATVVSNFAASISNEAVGVDMSSHATITTKSEEEHPVCAGCGQRHAKAKGRIPDFIKGLLSSMEGAHPSAPTEEDARRKREEAAKRFKESEMAYAQENVARILKSIATVKSADRTSGVLTRFWAVTHMMGRNDGYFEKVKICFNRRVTTIEITF